MQVMEMSAFSEKNPGAQEMGDALVQPETTAQTDASAQSALGAAMAVGSEVVIEAGEQDIDYSKLHTSFDTLLKDSIGDETAEQRRRITTTSTMLKGLRLERPAQLIALGRQGFAQQDANKKTTKAHVTALMEELGFADMWLDKPEISDIVPYCELSDVPFAAVDSRWQRSHIARYGVHELLESNSGAIVDILNIPYRSNSAVNEVPKIRKLLRNYAEAFYREKDRFVAQQQHDGSMPERNIVETEVTVADPLDANVAKLLQKQGDGKDSYEQTLLQRTGNALRNARVETPRNLIALGRQRLAEVRNVGTKSIDRTTAMMGTLGLADVWKDNPEINDIVPYCKLSDVPGLRVGVNDYRLRMKNVEELLEMPVEALRDYTATSRDKASNVEDAEKIRDQIREFAVDFMYAKAVRDGEIQPHPMLSSEA